MINQEQAWHDLTALPPQAQHYVIEFIAFLHTRYQQNQTDLQGHWLDESFVGMWHDNVEVEDSTNWVRGLHKQGWRAT